MEPSETEPVEVHAASYGPRFWGGAQAGAAAAAVAAAGLAASFKDSGLGEPIEWLVGLALGVGALLACRLAARWLAALLGWLPPRVALGLAAAAGALAMLRLSGFGLPAALFYPAALLFLLAQAVLGGALLSAWSGEWPTRAPRVRARLGLGVAVAIGLDAAALIWIAWPGGDPFPTDFSLRAGPAPETLSAPDPATPGDYRVEQLSYGVAPSARRPEFGVAADLRSRRVDASPLLPEWKGFDARAREWYWGFGLDAAPLNGRIWSPAGDGRHPLVLIVHGNHSMAEYSDPGYAWLGELLASRGMIAVSVDENYVNGSWSGDFGGREMALRAWLLLEHLRLWREWDASPGHRFEGRVDLERVALVGHSRGGEAAAIAAAFNRLPRFPDDATLAFDYGFGIRSVVAIAQIDRRYRRRVALEDVDFLALQGSYDSDEPAFHGLRQLNRLTFSGRDFHFKSGVYLHRANHGQFNSVWGRRDAGPPFAWLLNTAPILPAEDQRRVAAVFISGFLEASLRADRRYLPLLRDPRAGAHWLPQVALVAQYADSSTVSLADFDEDLDVTTASAPGARLATAGLALWREEQLRHRDELLQGTSAVVLGWLGEGDEAPLLELDLGEAAVPASADAELVFLISGSTESPPGLEADLVGPPRGVALELEDAAGRSVALPLDARCGLAPPLKVRFLKLAGQNRARYGADWEPVLQSCAFPLAAFREADPRFDPRALRRIRFRFDRAHPGTLLLDAIGLRGPEAAG